MRFANKSSLMFSFYTATHIFSELGLHHSSVASCYIQISTINFDVIHFIHINFFVSQECPEGKSLHFVQTATRSQGRPD